MKHFEVEYVHIEGLYLTTRALTFRTLRSACRWIRKHGEAMGAVRINYVRKDMYKKGRVSRMPMYILRADGYWGNPDTRRYQRYLNLKTGRQHEAPPRG